MSHHINSISLLQLPGYSRTEMIICDCYLLSVTGRNIVVGQLLVIIILVIKILQSFLLLKFTELKTQE